MAKKKDKPAQKITDFRNLKWCLNNLDDKELDAADAMEFDLGRFGEFLDTLILNEGMSFKFDFDAYSESFQMTLIGAWMGFPNTGYAVSVRSDAGFEDCARLLSFKFDVIATRDLRTVYEARPKRGGRG